MKSIRYIILFLTFVLTSCEKVIDFELKESEPVVVIESVVNDETGIASAKLSLTGDYYSSNEFPPVTQAKIAISVNDANKILLEETGAGLYEALLTGLQPGDKLTFNAIIQEKQYSATSTLQNKVTVDTVYYQYSPETVFAPEGYRVTAVFTDPKGKGNYYRIMLYVNNTLATQGIIYLYSDNATDGEQVNYILYRNSLMKGDRIRVELWSIDKKVYDYYAGLEKLVASYPGYMQMSPANPVSNISGGALGYFAAVAVTTSQEIIIE